MPTANTPATGAESVTGQVVGTGAVGGGAQGGGAAVPEETRPRWPLWIALALGSVLCAWCITAIVADRRRRALTSYDHMVRMAAARGPRLLKGRW